jgi:hypothetical protein
MKLDASGLTEVHDFPIPPTSARIFTQRQSDEFALGRKNGTGHHVFSVMREIRKS